MKTTIDIPDALMERCRAVMGRKQTTFRRLVKEGLHHVLAKHEQEEEFKLEKIPVRGGGFQPGVVESDWATISNSIYEGRGS